MATWGWTDDLDDLILVWGVGIRELPADGGAWGCRLWLDCLGCWGWVLRVCVPLFVPPHCGVLYCSKPCFQLPPSMADVASSSTVVWAVCLVGGWYWFHHGENWSDNRARWCSLINNSQLWCVVGRRAVDARCRLKSTNKTVGHKTTLPTNTYIPNTYISHYFPNV